MKHSNFYTLIQAIQNKEASELRAAVIAHGGKYIFDHDSDDYPIIAANPNSCNPNPIDVEVTEVVADSSGYIRVSGIEKMDRYNIDLNPSEIFAGHLSFIIDYIPETDTVKDVTDK